MGSYLGISDMRARRIVTRLLEQAEVEGWDSRKLMVEAAKRGVAGDSSVAAFMSQKKQSESNTQGEKAGLATFGQSPLSNEAVSDPFAGQSRIEKELARVSAEQKARGDVLIAPGGEEGGGGQFRDLYPQEQTFQPGVRYSLRTADEMPEPEFQGEHLSSLAMDEYNPFNQLSRFSSEGTEAAGRIRWKWRQGYYGEGKDAVNKALDDATSELKALKTGSAAAKTAGLEHEQDKELEELKGEYRLRAARTARPRAPKSAGEEYTKLLALYNDVHSEYTRLSRAVLNPKSLADEGMTRQQAEARLEHLRSTVLPQYQSDLSRARRRAEYREYTPPPPKTDPGDQSMGTKKHPYTVTDAASFERVPSGAYFVDPNGKLRGPKP